MTIAIQKLNENIGAEIRGVDLKIPLDDKTYELILDTLSQYAIILFREQNITISQQLSIARQFGSLENHLVPSDAHPDFPQIYVLSNIVKDGKLIGTPPTRQSGAWHSDYAYKREPASVSLFCTKVTPKKGGNTIFANMYAAYEALPYAMKTRVEGLKWRTSAEKRHVLLYPGKNISKEELAKFPDITHPIVRTHPLNGRKALFLGMSDVNSCEIVNLPVEEGQGLLTELRAFATSPRFIYSHFWRVGDAMLWDNRATIHRATQWNHEKYQRLAYRVVVKGDAPI